MADYATLVFDIDSAQATGAAKALLTMNKAVASAAKSTDVLRKAQMDLYRNEKGQFTSAADTAVRYADDIRRLAAEFNPLMDAELRLADAEVRLGQAIAAGVVPIERKEIELAKLRMAYIGTGRAATVFADNSRRVRDGARSLTSSAASAGKSSNALAFQLQNASYQVGDFFVQIASGTSAMRAASQQLPQLLGGFGLVGAAAGAAAAILGALLPVLLSGGKGAKSFDDAISSLSDRLSAYQRWVDYSRASTSVLAGEFGKGANNARQLADVMQTVAKIQFANQQMEATISLRDSMKSLTSAVQDYHAAALLPDGLQEKMAVLEESARSLADGFGLAPAQAERLNATLNTLVRSKTPDQIYQASKSIADQIAAAADNGAKIPPELLKAAEDAGKLAIQALSASNALDKAAGTAASATSQTAAWESAMSRVRGEVSAIASILAGISGTQIAATSAKVQADIIERTGNIKAASRAGAEYEANAARLARVSELVGQNVEYYKAAAIAQDEFTASMQRYDAQARLATVTAAQQEKERKAKSDSKSGSSSAKAAEKKAAAELKAAEKGFQSLRELLEKESLFQFAEYEKRQLQLDTALKKQLITRQEYDEYQKQLRINYFGTEYQQQQLRYDLEHQQLKDALEKQKITREEYAAIERQNQWRQVSELGSIRDTGVAYDLSKLAEGFGQAASMAGDYNSKFLKAQRVFAASAALISTYQGAAKALELPFPMNIAAAAKVLAAGMGFISAIKSGGSGGSSGGGGASSAGTVKQEPTRNVLVRLEGDAWLTDMAEQMMTQIYEASSNGRVIIARDNS